MYGPPHWAFTTQGNGYVVQCDSDGNMMLFDGLTGELYDTVSLGKNIEATPQPTAIPWWWAPASAHMRGAHNLICRSPLYCRALYYCRSPLVAATSTKNKNAGSARQHSKTFGALPPYKRKDTFNMDRVDIKELFAHPKAIMIKR